MKPGDVYRSREFPTLEYRVIAVRPGEAKIRRNRARTRVRSVWASQEAILRDSVPVGGSAQAELELDEWRYMTAVERVIR